MKILDIINEDGKIVKGVNTTVDVQPGETERQAAKFFGYNKDLIKKRKAKNPVQTLYNMGLAEGLNEDFGSVPPLVDLIVMAVLAKTTVSIIKSAIITAYKTGKGLKKIKNIANQAGVDLAAKFGDIQEDADDAVVKAALHAMKRLSDKQGNRHSLGDYAFSISRTFNLPISVRELVKKYNETY